MDIKKIVSFFRNVISDMKQDRDIYKQREERSANALQNYHPKYEIPLPNSRRGGKTEHSGKFPFIIPQIIGTVTGCAFVRMIHGNFALYIVLGIVFGIAMGVWKSMEYDKLNFSYALARNFIVFLFMTLPLELLFILPVLIMINL